MNVHEIVACAVWLGSVVGVLVWHEWTVKKRWQLIDQCDARLKEAIDRRDPHWRDSYKPLVDDSTEKQARNINTMLDQLEQKWDDRAAAKGIDFYRVNDRAPKG